MVDDIYGGNDFSISQGGDDWAIWRFCDDVGGTERIILTTRAMDELRDYFGECYSEDRADAQSDAAAQREP